MGNAQKFQAFYDTLAQAEGGRIHFAKRYYFTDPINLYSSKVVLTGNGPTTGFWFQLADSSKDAFVVEPLDPGNPASFLSLVEMRDFSVLGGPGCANNLVRIRYVVRSRFTGIHAMGGTLSHAIAIGTGWCNQFDLVASRSPESTVYAPSAWSHAPGCPASDYIHLLGSDAQRGGLNANRFWLLVEGLTGDPVPPPTYNLVRVSNQNGPKAVSGDPATTWTDQGNNWLSGTLEGNPAGYALYATGCDSMCLHQLHVEATQGICLVSCRQPVVSQTRWYSNLILDACLAPSVANSAGDTLRIEATTSYAGIGHVIVGQGGGTVINNSTSTVTTGPILTAAGALLGGGIATSVGAAPKFRGQTAIVGSTAYVSTGTSAPADWKQTTP